MFFFPKIPLRPYPRKTVAAVYVRDFYTSLKQCSYCFCAASKIIQYNVDEILRKTLNYDLMSATLFPVCAAVRTLNQVTVSVISRSANSQKVSIVLPSMRPSAPPISHNRASNE